MLNAAVIARSGATTAQDFLRDVITFLMNSLPPDLGRYENLFAGGRFW